MIEKELNNIICEAHAIKMWSDETSAMLEEMEASRKRNYDRISEILDNISELLKEIGEK